MPGSSTGAECTVAVPNLGGYSGTTGIGKVIRMITRSPATSIRFAEAAYRSIPLPLVRNVPYGLRLPPDTRTVLLPQLTGATALWGLRDVPSLAIVHDIGIVDCPLDRAELDPLTRRMVLQSFRALRRATGIVCVSEFTRTRLLHFLPGLNPEIVQVIHNGIDETFLAYDDTPNHARARTQTLLGEELRAPLLVYVGTERPRKNVGLLLEVLQGLKQVHPDAQLLKLGGPGDVKWRRNTIRMMESLRLQGGADVLFADNLLDQQLADAYSAADVFVSTSLYEGFCFPAGEAMAVGTPVVVTDRGAFPEVVGTAGWTVQPRVSDFVAAIVEAIHEGRSPRQAKRAHDRALRFSWTNAVTEYQSVLTEMCGRSRAASGQ